MLQTNKKMHEDYSLLMKNILNKGSAESCGSSSGSGKTWYLPHHGVYHPKKPNKIRIVFDCSAKYGGVSLNSLFLQGLDLTNQIVGVLNRFREDQVTLVGNIENMFYQVHVPKHQRICLEERIHQAHATMHLGKQLKNNTEQFGKEAASILINNFYVDHMLITDVPSALNL